MSISAYIFFALIVSVSINAALLVRRSSKSRPAPSAAPAKAAETPAPAPQRAPPATTYNIQRINADSTGILSGLLVMIADDNQVNIDVLSGMLELLGIEQVITVENGEQAVEAAAEHRIDLIYMDIQMPRVNGIEAAKRILGKPENRGLPIIPITGFSRVVNAEMCKAAGMTGFLQKPVDLNELQRITQIALRARRKPVAA